MVFGILRWILSIAMKKRHSVAPYYHSSYTLPSFACFCLSEYAFLYRYALFYWCRRFFCFSACYCCCYCYWCCWYYFAWLYILYIMCACVRCLIVFYCFNISEFSTTCLTFELCRMYKFSISVSFMCICLLRVLLFL